jgi:hypothetical protein
MSVDDFMIYSYNVGSIGKDILSFGFRSMDFMSKCEKNVGYNPNYIYELFLRKNEGRNNSIYSLYSLLINTKNLDR